MSRKPVRSTVGWIARVVMPAFAALAALTVAAGTASAGDGGQTSVPELGSGAAITAMALLAGASLIVTNRRSAK